MTAHRITAARTGAATAPSGGVAVSGVINGNVFAGAQVRSRYEEQVRRIAPPELVGRQEELAALAAFCTAPDVPTPYVWWRAKAWTGKSALMAWFVLNPPPAVQIVSFFVTARLASQDDRVAFADNVLEQLAALTGEPIPAYLTAATREAHLLGLLRDAAHLCRERGERLVLLVDGLDEDTGPDSYSVAALLPSQPAAGLRVIVAGRPDPPIPDDVPDHHPLRDPAIIRPLRASPAARVVRADMERDLDRILTGPEADRDLLGLLVAAGGGLSGGDLAELTGGLRRHVERKLKTVAGRSFASRPGYWEPEQVRYVMGHEELQQTALAELGPARLAAYRQRLHDWADGYRDRDWPEDTPEYLLRGYQRMLTGHRELDRMVACATDAARHDRMLARAGSDAQAIEHILVTQRAIVDSARPDVAALARVTMHRDRLHDRNTSIPALLPALWATLGQFERADNLALLAQEMDPTTETLANLMEVLVGGGLLARATRLVQPVAGVPEGQAEAGAKLIRIMARAGHLAGCRQFAGSVAGTKERISALAALSGAEVAGGNTVAARLLVEEIRTLVHSLPEGEERDRGAVGLVEALAAVADHDEAEAIVRSLTDWRWAPRAATTLIQSLALAGQTERADALLPRVNETSAWSDVVATLVAVAVDAGDLGRAEKLCQRDEDSYSLSRARYLLSRAYLRTNNIERSDAIGATIASRLQAEAYGGTVRTIAESGDIERATARLEAAPDLRPAALTGLAWAMVTTGHLDQAAELAQEAQQAILLVQDVSEKDRMVCELVEAITAANGYSASAEARIATWITQERSDHVDGARVRGLVRFGDLGQAEQQTRTIADPDERCQHLSRLAQAAMNSQDRPNAQRLAEETRLLLTSVPDPYWRAEYGAGLANVYAWLGDDDRLRQTVAEAEDIARSTESDSQQASVLGSLANAMLVAGDLQRATELAQAMSDGYEANRVVTVLTSTAVRTGLHVAPVTAMAEARFDVSDHGWIVKAHVLGLVQAGRLDEAELLAGTIDSPDPRAQAFVDVAAGGEPDRARRLTDAVLNLMPAMKDAHERSRLQLRLAAAVEPVPAVRLIAMAYPMLRWNGPLDAIVAACPDALPAIVDEFIALQQYDVMLSA